MNFLCSRKWGTCILGEGVRCHWWRSRLWICIVLVKMGGREFPVIFSPHYSHHSTHNVPLGHFSLLVTQRYSWLKCSLLCFCRTYSSRSYARSTSAAVPSSTLPLVIQCSQTTSGYPCCAPLGTLCWITYSLSLCMMTLGRTHPLGPELSPCTYEGKYLVISITKLHLFQ